MPSPSDYTPELGQALARLVAGGMSLDSAAKWCGVNPGYAEYWSGSRRRFHALLRLAAIVKSTREVEAILGRELGERSVRARAIQRDLASPAPTMRSNRRDLRCVDSILREDSARVVELARAALGSATVKDQLAERAVFAVWGGVAQLNTGRIFWAHPEGELWREALA